MEITEEKTVEVLWEDLNNQLQQGIPDVGSLQRSYNALTKFMSVCMVVLNTVHRQLELGGDPEEYSGSVRKMILQNMHYNERRLMRHLMLPEKKKKLAVYRDSLTQRFEQCKDIQRVLRDRLETFKFDFQLSGGNL